MQGLKKVGIAVGLMAMCVFMADTAFADGHGHGHHKIDDVIVKGDVNIDEVNIDKIVIEKVNVEVHTPTPPFFAMPGTHQVNINTEQTLHVNMPDAVLNGGVEATFTVAGNALVGEFNCGCPPFELNTQLNQLTKQELAINAPALQMWGGGTFQGNVFGNLATIKVDTPKP